jgi:alanine racemase
VLNSPEQVRRWRDTGRPCDVMVETGMNRLGIAPSDIAGGLLDGLNIETLMSHLACADEDSEANEAQRLCFTEVSAGVTAKRRSLANSAGICLGRDYVFDLTRPGLALYGGVPRSEAAGHIRQVTRVEAQIIQRRRVGPGDRVGYGGAFVAERDQDIAILNIGYADGYLRGFSGTGRARIGGRFAPVIGRVSMDMIAIGVDVWPELLEGDWVELDYDLPAAAAQSGLSQYELLTTLGSRFGRRWT